MVPYSPDLESFISMVLTAFWMQNLVFPWYLHQFGWKTSNFHGMYSILDAKPTYIGNKEYSYIYTYIHIYIYTYTYIHVYIYTYIHIFPGERRGTMTTYTTYGTTSTGGRGRTMTVRGRLPSGLTQLPHPQGGGGNHDHGGEGGSPNLEHIHIFLYIYIHIINI